MDTAHVDSRRVIVTDRRHTQAAPLFAETYGAENTRKWWVYWRVFFMAYGELWGYNDGEEWIVSHYRFHKP